MYNGNVDSVVNQEIKRKFVRENLYAGVTMETEYILSKSYEDPDAPFSYDDISNYFNRNEDKIEELTSEIEDLEEQIETIEGLTDNIKELEESYDDTEDEDTLEEINMLKEELSSYEDINKIKTKVDEIQEELDDYEEEYNSVPEIYEWYIVSSWLAKKLEEKGECIIDERLWGRQCCGQAVLLDGVISEICAELEILDGQKRSWADK